MKIPFKPRRLLCLLLTVTLLCSQSQAQNIIVNTAMLEGIDITPDNMWGFTVQSMETGNTNCRIDGSIVFRQSAHSIKYSFRYTLKPGVNQFDPSVISPQWTYSSTALKELFTYHSVLPQGTYRYCVTVTPDVPGGEYAGEGKVDDCIYKQSKDLFSITLVNPENNAKLYEFNPALSWVATYPFVNELTYKIRIAEIKEGQNTENAIVRNNPIYAENNLVSNSIVYPVYAKPLRVWQPYAWTVDAFYKGILLGGAQPWKFTIIEDSLFKSIPKESSYIDVNNDKGSNTYYAVGNVKFRYHETDFLKNELAISLVRDNGKTNPKELKWAVDRGDNFQTIDLLDHNFKHGETFEVNIVYKNARSEQFTQKIKYKYVNPDFIK